MEEGIVIGGGCTFLKLARKVDEVKATLDNDEQKVGIHLPHLYILYFLGFRVWVQGLIGQ